MLRKNIIFLVCPIWLPAFFLFLNEPKFYAGINLGMVLTPNTSSILDETRYKPTTF